MGFKGVEKQAFWIKEASFQPNAKTGLLPLPHELPTGHRARGTYTTSNPVQTFLQR